MRSLPVMFEKLPRVYDCEGVRNLAKDIKECLKRAAYEEDLQWIEKPGYC